MNDPRIKLDDAGNLDEVFVGDAKTVHLEVLDETHVFIVIDRQDGNCVTVALSADTLIDGIAATLTRED